MGSRRIAVQYARQSRSRIEAKLARHLGQKRDEETQEALRTCMELPAELAGYACARCGNRTKGNQLRADEFAHFARSRGEALKAYAQHIVGDGEVEISDGARSARVQTRAHGAHMPGGDH